ncbi:MAG: cell division protein FtsK [Bacteroidetes bacterium]|nr:MAG: cell division protein FtsK [Bacteroidota bacterium]
MARRKNQGRVLSVKKKTNLFKPIKNFLEDERFQKLSGVILLFIGAPYLLISFTSYLFTWSSDMSVVKELGYGLLSRGDIIVDNWLGRFGAVISHQFIYDWFGITSFLFVALCFIVGVRLLFEVSLLPVKRILKHSLFFLLWLSITLGYLFKNTGISSDVSHLMGGAFGIICDGWLEGLLGNIGSGFIIAFAFIAYLIISFNVSFSWFKKKQEIQSEDKGGMETTHTLSSSVIELGVDEEKTTTESEVPEDKSDTNELELEIPQSLKNDKSTKKEDDTPKEDLELIVEEGEKEETVSEDEIKDTQEFTEYDPTLDLSSYVAPGLDLLEDHGNDQIKVDSDELESNKDKIVETLLNYNIQIQKIKATVGPSVTLYEIVPAPGIRISKIKNLEDDIALSLSALGIRIIAPIPGKGTVGIEVPNKSPEIVAIKTVLASEKFINSQAELPLALGKTIANETLVADLSQMPHLLMAGATGQGKSVGLNAILVSLLYKKHPAQIKFVLIDPKIVELTLYKKIEKHFLAKLPDAEDAIISDTKKVVHTLNSLCIEMEQRYKLLQDAQVRALVKYNEKFINRKLNPDNGHRYLPYIVVVIDEFGDLIMTAGKEIESPLTRLAQKARAIGIHLIIATQRPTVNIITGTIKANFPVRIAFNVASKVDSRAILDEGGAEQLVGKGDMLFSTGNDLIRLQCAFVDTPEVEKITAFIGSQQGYPSVWELPEFIDEAASTAAGGDSGERDSMYEDAARIVVQHQQGSASLLQRRLKIGYNRAGRIVDQLEADGIVGPFDGSKARQVLMPDEYTLEQFLSKDDKPDESGADDPPIQE